MVKIDTLDPKTPLVSQLQEETGPVALINTFFVPSEVTEEFLRLWQEDAVLIKASPGFISTQLYQGVAGSQLLVNIAVWESAQALGRLHSSPEFRQKNQRFPDGVVAYPHVFEKIAVAGVCVA